MVKGAVKLRIYISADGEGVSGVVSAHELQENGRDHQRFRHWMTQDVNAAVRGAFAGGAAEVVVNDAHSAMVNLIFEELDPRVEVIRGCHKDLGMVEQVAGCDGVFFVGYHTRVGRSDGVGNETMTGAEMYEMRMNGQAVGEMEMNAAVAGHYHVPVIMVAGDDCLQREALAYFGDVETAVVKFAIDRWTARCLSYERAHQAIETAAQRAVRRIKDFQPKKVDGPVEFEIEWTSTAECRKAALVPGSCRKTPRIVAYRGEDIIQAWKGILACLRLGCTASDPVYG